MTDLDEKTMPVANKEPVVTPPTQEKPVPPVDPSETTPPPPVTGEPPVVEAKPQGFLRKLASLLRRR
jgi:hypothetical protein